MMKVTVSTDTNYSQTIGCFYWSHAVLPHLAEIFGIQQVEHKNAYEVTFMKHLVAIFKN